MIDIKKFQISYVTDAKGKRTSVIMPLRQFRQLLEDVEDLAAVAERREEPTIMHEDLIAELKRDGIL